MIYRCILPEWAQNEDPSKKKVLEDEFSDAQIAELNSQFYNIYFLPNYPSDYQKGAPIKGYQVDTFSYVFADMDLKDNKYPNKQAFIDIVKDSEMKPTFIVDSGNGVHVYWEVIDLDAMNFLKLQRRIIRKFSTDEAVGQIFQLMRVPGTINTKLKDGMKKCEKIFESDKVYTCEELDKFLPIISSEDEQYCRQHYDRTYNIQQPTSIDEKIPLKFSKLLESNPEVKSMWQLNVEDRSKADYRLGHIMFASGFTKEEALSVLVNTAKAASRSPANRISYAENIINKIWTFEICADKDALDLSQSVKDILEANPNTLKGKRFPCHKWIDGTEHGFRLGQVLGLVAGSGVGKTAVALNMFRWFVERNPEYDHFFVPLEQPATEIADRWKSMTADNTTLHNKVQIISNYDTNGSFRHLSFQEIKEYILKFQRVTGRKVGCVVIDHIGALKKKGKDGENQDLMTICHEMKAFAIQTNTFLVMQSQSPREKAGIGDLELNKDAAYGTVYFESYCDYMVSMWQPLKRCYNNKACPTVTAFKFCKIRSKNQNKDRVKEDVCYRLFFNPDTQHFRDLTEQEEKSFDYFNNQALVARKRDRKTDLVTYQSVRPETGEINGKTSHSEDTSSV